MSGKPLKSWDRQHSSEVMDYVLETLIPEIECLSNGKADRAMVLECALDTVAALGSKADQRETSQYIEALSQKIEAMKDAMSFMADKVLSGQDLADFKSKLK